jgi:hypothetical protein
MDNLYFFQHPLQPGRPWLPPYAPRPGPPGFMAAPRPHLPPFHAFNERTGVLHMHPGVRLDGPPTRPAFPRPFVIVDNVVKLSER